MGWAELRAVCFLRFEECFFFKHGYNDNNTGKKPERFHNAHDDKGIGPDCVKQQAGISGICDKPFDTLSVKQIIRQLLAA